MHNDNYRISTLIILMVQTLGLRARPRVWVLVLIIIRIREHPPLHRAGCSVVLKEGFGLDPRGARGWPWRIPLQR
jgi:hypothetical protein